MDCANILIPDSAGGERTWHFISGVNRVTTARIEQALVTAILRSIPFSKESREMKRVLITMVLATGLASIPVFAGTCERAERASGTYEALLNAGAPASPQFRRRYRRRYLIVRLRHRPHRLRRRHY